MNTVWGMIHLRNESSILTYDTSKQSLDIIPAISSSPY